MISLGECRTGVLYVAHPDDEALWCGGLLVRHAAIQWTVVCCSVPRRDPVRAELFVEACRRLGADAVVVRMPEGDPSIPFPHMSEIPRIEADVVVTHGPEGEYGHAHHKALSAYLSDVFPGVGKIGYRPDGRSVGTYSILLSDEEWQKKLHALQAYDHVLPWHGQNLPKWQALLLNYGPRFNLRAESYDGIIP